MSEKNNSSRTNFLFGFVSGIAIISVIGFLALLPKVWGDGVLTKADKDDTEKVTDTKKEVPKDEGVSVDTWKALAKELKLDTESFNTCLDGGKKASKVAADMAKGRQEGVTGTPGTFINGEKVSGAIPYEDYTGQDGTQKSGLKSLVEKHLTDTDTNTEIGDDEHVKGSKDAPVMLVEYSDFECPYCGRHQLNMQKVASEFGDKVAFVFRHFPLSFHPQAQKAAEAVECAGDKDKFWEMHDRIFTVFLSQ